MSYLLCIVLIILSLARIKNKKIVAYGWIIYDVIMMSLNDNIADRDNYFAMYERIGNGSFLGERVEIGFRYLIKFVYSMGMNVHIFIFILSLITISLYTLIFIRYVKNYNLLFLMYLIFPMMLDACQIRSMLVNAIVLFAIRFLEEKRLRNIIIYILLIILATSIHTEALFYLTFLCVYVVKNKKHFLKMNIIIFPIIIFLAMNGTVLKLVSKVIGSSNILLRYVEAVDIGRTFIIGYILMVTTMFIISLVQNSSMYNISNNEYMGRNDKDIILSQRCSNFLNVAYFINIISLWTVAFLLFSNEFTRLYRPFAICNYIVFAIYLESNKKKLYGFNFSKGVCKLAYIVCCFIIVYICAGSVFDNTYVAVFKYNFIF